MTKAAADRRPPRFPPPQFPPHRPKLFAATPPAIFPPVLGLMILALALRQAAASWGELPRGLADLFLGLVVGLWALVTLAIKVKVWRRISVLAEDLRPLPGRAGLAAGGLSGVAMAWVLLPFSPDLAVFFALASVVALGLMAAVTLRVMTGPGAEGLGVNPTWASFASFGLAVPPLVAGGWSGTAQGLALVATVLAGLIWGASAVQLWREVPPAPLRPMRAAHVTPAAALSLAWGALGQDLSRTAFLALALLMALGLLASARWLLASGRSALWGELCTPLALLTLALGADWPAAGLVLLLPALAIVGWIAWEILWTWPTGQLARRSHAAEA